MMKILFTGCVFLLSLCGQTQTLKSFKGYCGLYYKDMEGLIGQKQKEIDFYRFQPGQVVASIGAQCGHWEASYAACVENVHFYLEDIDSTYFNERQVGFAWRYYDSLRGKPMTSRYSLVLGNERATLLPEKTFDKIMIINSFHEFTEKEQMLADLKTKLKPGGLLYIDESLPRRPGQLHGICKHPMLSEPEMNAILMENGFEYAGGLELQFRKKRPDRKIYAFRMK
jgi:ubiquinone/menaquinone biosynthesis C-methylase UbiE